MRKGLISVLVAVAGLLGAGSAAATQCTLGTASTCLVPHLAVTLGGSVAPRILPSNEYAPATWKAFGKFETSTGTHLPALRELEVDIDKDVKLNANGYPVCRGDRRDMGDPNPKAVMMACRSALLGKGEAHVEIAFPGQDPVLVKSPLTVFNGGEKGGKVKLLIHIFLTAPVPAAVVADVTITQRGTGVHTVLNVPAIAGGNGSLVDFKFKLGKTYSYKGKKVGYFEAKCPDGVFKASVKRILFKNEAHTEGEGPSISLKGNLAVPCASRG